VCLGCRLVCVRCGRCVLDVQWHCALFSMNDIRTSHARTSHATHVNESCHTSIWVLRGWLGACWVCVGCVLGLYWVCAGCVSGVLGVYWVCIGCVLGACWVCVGCVLGVCWVCVGCILGLYWVCVGCVSGVCLVCVKRHCTLLCMNDIRTSHATCVNESSVGCVLDVKWHCTLQPQYILFLMGTAALYRVCSTGLR